MNRLVVLLKSKTVWGAVASAIGFLLTKDHVGAAEVVQAVGGVVTAVGVRDSISKATAPPE